MSVAVWIGTRKGAFVARSKDRKTWKSVLAENLPGRDRRWAGLSPPRPIQ
jgi:hypothetical protein